MDVRKRDNIYRPDMIHLLMQAREGSLKIESEEKSIEVDGFATVEESDVGKRAVNRVWDGEEIVAQWFLFFAAGFETVSTVLVFTSYELIANPYIQQKLYEEIVATNEQINGKRVNYDSLQRMKFLDQVICEVLRKWPPAVATDRACVKDYQYDDGKLKFDIEKSHIIQIPIYDIHHNPKYFLDPDRFDPERFNEENKHNIAPGTYIPFGVGPRNCIG